MDLLEGELLDDSFIGVPLPLVVAMAQRSYSCRFLLAKIPVCVRASSGQIRAVDTSALRV